MYTKNLEMAMGLFDEILDELARAARTKMDNGKGCVGVSINPIDGSRQLTEMIENKPTCSCSCKSSNSMMFKDIIDDIESVIFNDPATIVTFKDGSKVCVKACEKDTFLCPGGCEEGVGFRRGSARDNIQGFKHRD
jgi:hypothetical protein